MWNTRKHTWRIIPPFDISAYSESRPMHWGLIGGSGRSAKQKHQIDVTGPFYPATVIHRKLTVAGRPAKKFARFMLVSAKQRTPTSAQVQQQYD